MTKHLLAIVLLVATGIGASAQHLDKTGGKEFALFSQYASSVHKVNLSVPKDFKVLEYETDSLWLPITNYWLDGCQGITPFFLHSLVSNDGNCMLFYPALDGCDIIVCEGRSENDVYNDLAASIHVSTGKTIAVNDTTKPTLQQMVTELSPEKAKRLFNADRMLIATLPMAKPYRDAYTRCFGVYLFKAGHMPLYFKILLTDAVKTDIEKYINILAANVSYLNDKPTLSGKKQIDEWYAYVKRVKELEKSIH